MKNFITRTDSSVAIIVSVCLSIFFTYQFNNNPRISDSTYFGFVSLSFVIGLIIYFRRYIKEIDIKNLKLILEKAEEVKHDISAIAKELSKIIATLSAHSTGNWRNRKQLNDQIEILLNKIDIDQKEIKQILELPRIVEKSMKNKEPLTPDEQTKVNEMFKLEEK